MKNFIAISMLLLLSLRVIAGDPGGISSLVKGIAFCKMIINMSLMAFLEIITVWTILTLLRAIKMIIPLILITYI